MGGEVRQYRVSPQPPALRALGVNYEQIEKALASFGTNAGGGFTDLNSREYLIRNIGRTTSLDDLRNIVVAKIDGKPVFLHQVATVEFAPRAKRGDSGYMGKPAVHGLGREAAECRHRHADAQHRGGADGAERDACRTTSRRISWCSGRRISSRLRSGTCRRCCWRPSWSSRWCCSCSCMNWRTTLISLTAIPASILITAVVFYFAGLSINTMTLGGIAIAIGELVDDAVVGVENIFRRLRENRALGNPRSAFDVVVSASQEVRSGIVYATMIIVLVFVPLFALAGIEGRLFAPLGVAYIVSILASLVVSITLTPVMAYYMLPGLKSLNEHESGLVRVLKRGYGAALARAYDNANLILGVTLLLVIAAAAAAFTLPRSFLPPFNEGTFNILVSFNPGVSLAESNRVGTIAEQLIMQVPEVKSVGRRTGRAELDEHAEGIHVSELEVDLNPSSASEDRNRRRYPSHGSACCRCRSISASRSRTGSTTCCPASAPRSR